MIKVNTLINLDESELNFSFVKASGPGGQNVNKVATSVQLKFNVYKSANLPEEIKEKIIKNAGKKATSKGNILIEAKRYRTQEKNKTDAIERLVKLISQSAKVEKKRKRTKPTKAAAEKRIEVKKKKSSKKILRKKISKNNEY